MTITSLMIYPIKSCKGVAVTESALTTRGLAYDRQWLVRVFASKTTCLVFLIISSSWRSCGSVVCCCSLVHQMLTIFRTPHACQIVDGVDGHFVTQRQEPRMALIAPKAVPSNLNDPLVR